MSLIINYFALLKIFMDSDLDRQIYWKIIYSNY